jgi:hypothetical protein
MRFIVDNDNKIIFGWSPKCACSHIKKIYYFLRSDNDYINNIIHTPRDNMNLPQDINKYTTIIFIRNPYKRIISGFLDKYSKRGEYRPRWKHPTITFKTFVNELIKHDCKNKDDWKNMIEYHHFTQQTSEKFNKMQLLKSHTIILNDIENIDYEFIEKIYNKKIPETLLNFKGNHSRKTYKEDYNDFVYDLDMELYFNYNVNIKYFFDIDIKNKLRKFYKDDFLFFKKFGFDYENNTFDK